MADNLQATPRNQLLGLLSDAMYGGLDWMKSPERTQQMQGLAGLLESTGIPQTTQRMAYGEPLTNIGRANVPLLKPETAEAMMNVAPLMPAVGRLASRAVKATEGMPVGMSIKDVGSKIKVKPPTDDVYDVMDATFNYGKLGGNKTIPIDQLTGGVRMSDPTEARRVKELADKISSPEGYISRIIVDDSGNVLEGQHRLEALRLLGEKNVPVSVIQDLSKKYDVPAMERTIEGKLHPDQVTQLVRQAIDTLEEAGSVEKALSDYSMLARFQQPFQDAIRASKLAAQSFKAPQQAALDLAQQRAALPVEQGGLGLPANNTPQMRAQAMGGKDMVHFSRTGGDYTTLDSGKFAIAPFDAVGTHVGTPKTAMDRFRNTTATTDQIKGTTYPVTILGDRPLMNQNGMPWGEDDLNAFLRKEGGHNWSDIQGGKMTYQDMNADLRKKLFEKQGYTSIPYFNEVEGKGSISYIVPPENIRSRFAAFDPFRRDVATATAMGVALPDLLAAEPTPQSQSSGLLYPFP